MDKAKEMAPTATKEAARRDTTPPMFWANPFAFTSYFTDEMLKLFNGFGLEFGGFRPFWRASDESGAFAWSPDVEMWERDGELVVHVDLPGLTKDNVKVEVTENGITIHGERKHEHEEKHEGFYRTERSYGTFHRFVPVPEGAIVDRAKATFKNGVLEVSLPTPPREARRGRQVEVKEA